MKKTISVLLLLIGVLVPAGQRAGRAAGSILYVDADAGPGGDGSSWTNAYADLQAALAVATTGDQIWVAEGVYKPGNLRESLFLLVDDVDIYGGFDGTETALEERDWLDHVTVLSGDIDSNDLVDATGVVTDATHIVGNNAYNVVYCICSPADSSRLDGVTITGGKADDPIHQRGGGMVGDNCRLSNVTFSGNFAKHGGGLWGGDLALTNVTFVGNLAEFEGGGMLNGGNPTLTDVTFRDNQAGLHGGGVYNGGTASLANVTFVGNTAEQNGGGIYNINSQCDGTTLVNVRFSGNSAHNGAGLMNSSCDAVLVNVTFSGNLASYGGAINNQRSNPTLANTILWSNSAKVAGNQIHNDPDSEPTISYSLIQLSGGSGSGWTSSLGIDGGGNIDLDPLFVDVDGPDATLGTPDDNLRLQSTSPAIDAGDSTSVPVDSHDLDGDGNTAEILPYDLDNHARFADMPVADTGFGAVPIVDMGAYEANSEPIANAGPAQMVAPGTMVALDGSGSSDPDSHPLSFRWTQTGGPSVALSDAVAVEPTFVAPAAQGDLTFELAVTDLYGLSDSDSVTIGVGAFYVYLPIILR